MIGARYNNAVDPYFETNVAGGRCWSPGRRLPLPYATTTAMAESDADFVLNLIKDHPISYPVVLDVEAQEMNNLTPAQLDIINAFCKKSRQPDIIRWSIPTITGSTIRSI